MVQHLTAKTGGQAKALVATLLYTIPTPKSEIQSDWFAPSCII